MINLKQISSGLVQREDGVWHAQDNSMVSYPEKGNEICAEVGDASFWFKHRNECIVSLIKSFPPCPDGVIFAVGGGNGYVAQALVSASFEVVLIEPGSFGVRVAKRRGLEHIICSSLDDAEFAECSLPAVGLFDVVEHIEDDLTFLRTVNSLLTPDGRVYITVPAYSFLWSEEDESAGHYRRYTLKSLTTLLQSTGFEVAFSTYTFWFLPLPVFLLRSLPTRLHLVKRGHPESSRVNRDHAPKGGISRQTLDFLLDSEVRYIKRLKSKPFGGSCMVAASKNNVLGSNDI